MDTGQNCKLILKGSQPPQEFELTRDELFLGRDTSADIVISSQAVSRRHARLFQQGGRYFLEDLKSSNGTFLNGKQVQGAVPLSPGDQVGLGPEVVLTFDDPRPRSLPTRFGNSTLQDLQRTIQEADRPEQTILSSPRLVVTVTGMHPQSYPLRGERIRLGRAEDNDIVIPSKIVSRYHALLEPSGKGYRISILPEASNALLFQGRAILQPLELKPGDEIQVDSRLPGMAVTWHTSPAISRPRPSPQLRLSSRRKLQPIPSCRPCSTPISGLKSLPSHPAWW